MTLTEQGRWPAGEAATSTTKASVCGDPRPALPRSAAAHWSDGAGIPDAALSNTGGAAWPTGLQISELSLDPLGQVAVRFDSGLSLLLGQIEFPTRERFKRLWEEELPAQAVAKVDLRYDAALP